MRAVKMKKERMTLEQAAEHFLLVKEAQHTSKTTMQDYRNCLRRFIQSSHNSTDYATLEKDVLAYFSTIPETSPARYNKPFQNVNALLRWMVDTEILPKNPIAANKLHKRKDDGNVKPASIEELKAFLSVLDKKTYNGLRTYVLTLVMIDTGARPKELASLHDTDYDRGTKSLCISKTVAKTRQKRIAYLSAGTARAVENFIVHKPAEWDDWLFPNYDGHQLTVTYIDRDFAKYSAMCGRKITPYQLRHSFATLFLKSGGDLFSLQHLMGHADLRMTKRYTELDDEYIEQQHHAFSPVNLVLVSEKKRMR